MTQLAPEKRFYQASQTPQTMVANHSTLAWDLYVVYEGKNPDSGLPIIKVFLNPLVAWIWIGVFIVIAGTATASDAEFADRSGRRPGERDAFLRTRPSSGAAIDVDVRFQ